MFAVVKGATTNAFNEIIIEFVIKIVKIRMSSPRNMSGSVREGTRVVLREITASLHNSPPVQPSRRKVFIYSFCE